jgi:hypothetical protein
LRIEGAVRYSLDEIASYAIKGGQIAVFAALGLVLTAIMLGSACHNLRSLPRGLIRWGAAALAVLAFEAPFLWLAGVEPDVSWGEFAGAIVLGVVGFMLTVGCALALMDLAGLLAWLAGPSGRFRPLWWSGLKLEDINPQGEKALPGPDWVWALAVRIVQLVFLV